MVEDHIDREATELQVHAPPPPTDEPEEPHTVRRSESYKRQHGIKKFWKRQIAITVHHEDCRDHFALERTYLGYLRTSVTFAILGVVLAQLFHLKNQGSVNPPFGFFNLGIPLACICIGSALMVTVFGSWRFWRQQNALARGKVHAGGWELNGVGVIGLLVAIVIFALVLAVEVTDESETVDF